MKYLRAFAYCLAALAIGAAIGLAGKANAQQYRNRAFVPYMAPPPPIQMPPANFGGYTSRLSLRPWAATN